MAIERYEGQNIVRPVSVADVSGGFRSQSNAAGKAARVLDQVSDQAFERAAGKAALDGRLAGAKDAIQYDEEGNLLPLTSLPPADTIYGQAYRQAAMTNYAVAAQVQAGLYADKLAREHALDAEGFRQSFNAYTDKFLADGHPDIAPLLKPHMVRIGGQKFGAIADAQAEHERQTVMAGIDSQVQSIMRAAMHQADTLRVSDSAMLRTGQILAAEVAPLLQSKVGASGGAYTEQDMAEDLRKFQGQLVGQAIASEAWEIANSSRVVLNGVAQPNTDKAEAWLNSLESDPPEMLAQLLGPGEIAQLTAGARDWIGLKSGETAIAEQRQAEQNQVAAARATAAWEERIDLAGDPTEIVNLYGDIDQATFSADPVVNENTRRHLKTMARNRIAAMQKQIADQAPLAEGWQRALSGEQLAPDADGRKVANYGLDMMKGLAQDGDPGFDVSDPAARPNLLNWARRIGVLPDEMVAGFRAGPLMTGNPDRLASTAANYVDMLAANPAIADQVGSETHAFLREFQNRIDAGGLPAEVAELMAAKMDRLANTPRAQRAATAAEYVADREQVHDDFEGSLSDIETGNYFWSRMIAGLFGSNPPPGADIIPSQDHRGFFDVLDPTSGLAVRIPPVPRQLENDFAAALELHMARGTGDVAAARELAMLDVAKNWGISRFAARDYGDERTGYGWARRPVEHVSGLPREQIRTSLAYDLETLDRESGVIATEIPDWAEKIEDGEVWLEAREREGGYTIWYRDQYGTSRTVNGNGPAWTPAAVTPEQFAQRIEDLRQAAALGDTWLFPSGQVPENFYAFVIRQGKDAYNFLTGPAQAAQQWIEQRRQLWEAQQY